MCNELVLLSSPIPVYVCLCVPVLFISLILVQFSLVYYRILDLTSTFPVQQSTYN